MLGTLSALRFIAANTVAPASEAPGEEIPLRLADGAERPADLYRAAGRKRGLILFVHGMSPAGPRDVRMCRASRALAAAGFDVLTPLVPDFQALRVDPATTDEIAATITAVHARQDLTEGRRLGLFSISYSAAISLLAAARPEVGARISAICALGTFSDAVTWARFLMVDPRADEYGRMIILYNFLHRLTGDRPAIREALWVALMDHWHKRAEPEFPGLLARMAPEDRALAEAIRDDPAAWARIGTALVDRIEGDFDFLNVRRRAPQIAVPTVLLHGSDDPVVPAAESTALHAALSAAGQPTRLVVTPLLGHGEASIGLRTLPEAVSVVAGLGEFFTRVARG